jgi:multiple sugar transport system ATP-binding protein
MAASLHIAGIRKVFGKGDKAVEVLKKIDIMVAPGEFLILVGPSGCGKSTLLNIIAGLEDPTEGELKIAGKNVIGVAPAQRDIAMVFQSYALYPTMSVADNIGFALEMRKVPKDVRTKRIQQVAEMLQIQHLLDRRPAQLSGGQRQRVAMGRALARDPQLFLFDEPLSNLDAKLRVEMRAEIKRLHQCQRHHQRVRDARPDRGHDLGHPHCGDERRHPAADRHARRHLPPAGQYLCGRIHWLTHHEFYSW